MPPKPKLTPEEKKALKAAKKAEKKLQLIEKKKQIKRDYLDREVKYGELTIKRHEREWRQMLINIALPKMKEDLEFAWHNFERVIDCKNFAISLLMDEIRDAEQQYVMNDRNHMEHINKLIDLFRVQLEELQKDNEQQVANLIQRAEEQSQELKIDAVEEDIYLKTMIYKLEMAWKEQKQNVRAEYFSKLEEEGTKYAQIIQRLRGVLEKDLLNMCKQTREFLRNFEERTRARKKEHDKLKAQDDSVQKLLVIQLGKLRKMSECVRRLKSKYKDSCKLLSNRLKDIKDENNYFTFVFSHLKMKLQKDRERDFNQMRILTVNYNSAIQYLEKLQEKGEHILHATAVCRKLETQEEKIMPFPVPEDSMKVYMDDQDEYLESLDLFWQRVAQADASRYSINEEREFLKSENQILRMKLHKYCQCVTCPFVESKMISNGKCVTDGVLEMKKYEKHNYKQFYSNEYDDEIDE
ncbi:coiled-coil domain-containing protein 65-like [Anoplophora glabripennis]|uniref:coiled-coil domain-containing protein 65-like n=1 Tax=Anoplophora glabripennis TaxID=217634 RepID=UPI000C75AB25|nr:coiled-coil domain-containing protein 65-like [Anoplophora glabripennis]